MNLTLKFKPMLSRLLSLCWRQDNWRLSLLFTLLLIVGLVILGFSFSSLIYFIYASTGNPVTWKQALGIGFTQWTVWCWLYWLIFWLTRRFPIERQHWFRGVTIYIFLSFGVTLLKLALDGLWIRLAKNDELFRRFQTESLLAIMLYFNFLTYWAFVGVGHAFNFYKQLRERELRASQLESQLAQSQLQALKMQLQPHFLFNTLHTISMLNLKDSKAANRMISRLSDLLRLTLDNTGSEEVTLKQELDFLNQYLEIQQIRFQDRLQVKMEIDPETLDACVPNLILQPIVENAIRHGIADQETDGRIEIEAVRQNGWLKLCVHDNGPGILDTDPKKFKQGIGLRNTQARLEQMYGAGHSLIFKNACDGGLEVTITIPFRILADEKESNRSLN
jgi:two-component system, LytTR family, sensor kinase